MSEKRWYKQHIPCSTNRAPRDLRLASRSRWELRYIPGYYAASSTNSTCSSNYLRLQVSQPQCLRVIGNHPRRTPTSHLHNSLNIQPTPVLIHRLTYKFCAHCPSHPNQPVQLKWNYTLAVLTNLCTKILTSTYKAYTALISWPEVAVCFCS